MLKMATADLQSHPAPELIPSGPNILPIALRLYHNFAHRDNREGAFPES